MLSVAKHSFSSNLLLKGQCGTVKIDRTDFGNEYRIVVRFSRVYQVRPLSRLAQIEGIYRMDTSSLWFAQVYPS